MISGETKARRYPEAVLRQSDVPVVLYSRQR